MYDKSLSIEEKNVRLIEQYTTKQREWALAKLDIANAKRAQDVIIGIDSSNKKQ